jgi:glycosyltransferase involved in cell wall biosynthesis
VPLRILFVGRFHEQKNLNFLLRQFARLPAKSFELHLVGDGPQEKLLRNLANQLGIAESIVWHGWLPRAALPGIYRSSDCLVNPSLYEGMPNVVLEAMACGLPVLASNIKGHDEIVVNNETGLLFDLGEPDALISAFKRMLDVDLRRRMGVSGRARAVTVFSWRTTAEKYLQLFSR